MRFDFVRSICRGLLNTAFAMFVLVVAWANPAFSQMIANEAISEGAVATTTQLPKGVSLLAAFPLNGQPVTRMHTQWESGRNYLYLEQGSDQLLTIDVTKKQKPFVAAHAPAHIEAARYEQLAEGGTFELTPMPAVHAGADNANGEGFPTLDASDPKDASILKAFGQDVTNLADRDRNLVFIASSSRLLVLQDKRSADVDSSGY